MTTSSNYLLKRFLLFFCVLICLIDNSNAQSLVVDWDKSYGGTDEEYTPVIARSALGRIYIVGHTFSDSSGNKSENRCPMLTSNFQNPDLWILEIDTNGNILNQKNIGGNVFDREADIAFDAFGNVLVSCQSSSYASCSKSNDRLSFDYWVICLDPDLNIKWDRTLGGYDVEDNVKVFFNNSKVLVGGLSFSTAVGGTKTVANWGDYDFWVTWLDTAGTILQDKNYGGDLVENYFAGFENEGENILLCGSTRSGISGDISSSSRGDYDYWIIKVDTLGNKIDDNRYGGNSLERTRDLVKANQNGYLIGGESTSPVSGEVSQPILGQRDVWLIRIDSALNKIWDYKYGGLDNDYLHQVEATSDNGFIVLSGIDSLTQTSQLHYGRKDYWLFKIDSVGQMQWEMRFGGAGTNTPNSFCVLPSGSIIMAGVSYADISAVKTDTGYGGYDYWVIKVHPSTTTSLVENESLFDFSVGPNPFHDEIEIGLSGRKFDGTFNLFNMLGQEISLDVEFLAYNKFKLSPKNASSGLYTLTARTKGGNSKSKLILKY